MIDSVLIVDRYSAIKSIKAEKRESDTQHSRDLHVAAIARDGKSRKTAPLSSRRQVHLHHNVVQFTLVQQLPETLSRLTVAAALQERAAVTAAASAVATAAAAVAVRTAFFSLGGYQRQQGGEYFFLHTTVDMRGDIEQTRDVVLPVSLQNIYSSSCAELTVTSAVACALSRSVRSFFTILMLTWRQ